MYLFFSSQAPLINEKPFNQKIQPNLPIIPLTKNPTNMGLEII